MAMDLEQARENILFATLPHVPFDGWTHTALAAGARDAGLEPVMAQRAFPGGPAELAEAFSDWADRAMLEALEGQDLAAMKAPERIVAGLTARLDALAPHREAVRQAMAFMALPGNGLLVLRLGYRTVDALWYAAGDTSTDYNFYTKRALVAGVYASTVLYWLNDNSEGFADTRAFLERRITDATRVSATMARVKRLAEAVPSPFRLARAFPSAGARRRV
jgi:ubiquinone biosynthesis protein COQ9